MPETHVLIAEGQDMAQIIEDFTAELAEKLLLNEEVGKHIISTYENDEDKVIFKMGYVAALIDYHIAVMSGRLKNFDYGTKINGT